MCLRIWTEACSDAFRGLRLCLHARAMNERALSRLRVPTIHHGALWACGRRDPFTPTVLYVYSQLLLQYNYSPTVPAVTYGAPTVHLSWGPTRAHSGAMPRCQVTVYMNRLS